MNKSDYDELSMDSVNSDNKSKVVIEDKRKKKSTYKGFKDNKRNVLLDYNKRIMKLV